MMLWLILWILHFWLTDSAIECHNKSSCAYTSIRSYSDDIECYGLQSCFESPKLESTYNADIQCYGSYSCFNSTIIQHTHNSTSTVNSYIQCRGLFACAFIDYLYNQQGGIHCHSEYSCYNSFIDCGTSSTVSCYGTRSCANSILKSANTYEFSGYLAVENSIIYTTDSSVEFKLRGSYAGYNATIICLDYCKIVCSSTACNNLNTICFYDNDNCTIEIQCSEYDDHSGVERSIACPQGFELPYLYQLPNLTNVTLSTFDNSIKACNINTTAIIGSVINCDGYQDCYGSNRLVSNDSDIYMVCCTGFESCEDAFGITTQEGGIRLDAYNAGYNYDATDAIYLSNGGDIFIAGSQANVNIFGETLIEADGIHDIISSGFQSTWEGKFNNANNLYCMGADSCIRSKVWNMNNIYAYGYESLEFSSVKYVGDSLYCQTYSGCAYCNISDVNNNIIGLGTRTLVETSISNVYNTLVGYGWAVLQQSTIINVSNVCRHVFGFRIDLLLFFSNVLCWILQYDSDNCQWRYKFVQYAYSSNQQFNSEWYESYQCGNNN